MGSDKESDACMDIGGVDLPKFFFMHDKHLISSKAFKKTVHPNQGVLDYYR